MMAFTRYLSDVRFWPIADIGSCIAHVRFWSDSGHWQSARNLPRCGPFHAASINLTGPSSNIVHALFTLAMSAGTFQGMMPYGFYRKMVWICA
jgi:hypothetical protein